MSFYEVVESQLQRLNILSDPNSPLFWPFLLTLLPLTVYAWRRDGKRNGKLALTWRAYLAYLFPRGLRRSRSVRLDLKFFVLGPMIMSVIGYQIIVATSSIPAYVSDGLAYLLGERSIAQVTLVDRISLTALSYLAIDFGFYLVHYLEHRIPILWKYHKVHHSATVLNPLTDFRSHPIQLALTLAVTSVFSSVVVGIFLYVNGTHVSEVNYLGVNIFNMLLFGFATALRHSHVWVSFGPLSYLVISPAMHQIHHSCEDRHFNKNFSGNLAIWDWMFGTIYVPKARERFRVGIGREGRQLNRKSFFDLLFNP